MSPVTSKTIPDKVDAAEIKVSIFLLVIGVIKIKLEQKANLHFWKLNNLVLAG